ncbi:hypothetical protein VTJ04DRAFT_3017 [Mycothermus thermophilus]|uniref:uncharacterized protein n=1 Tax=Humicola insolens TaxID=85995 RepID=UPI00374454F1
MRQKQHTGQQQQTICIHANPLSHALPLPIPYPIPENKTLCASPVSQMLNDAAMMPRLPESASRGLTRGQAWTLFKQKEQLGRQSKPNPQGEMRKGCFFCDKSNTMLSQQETKSHTYNTPDRPPNRPTDPQNTVPRTQPYKLGEEGKTENKIKHNNRHVAVARGAIPETPAKCLNGRMIVPKHDDMRTGLPQGKTRDAS